MFRSRRALAVIGAIVVALVIAIVVFGRRGAVESREIARVEGATRLVWTRATGPRVVIEKTGAAWAFREPFAAPADAHAVEEVLAALRGARWHRRASASGHAATTTLRIESPSGATELGVADALAGSEQTWVVAGDRALLVDDWVARALGRRAFELQVRAPLAAAAAADSIRIERDGPPLALEYRPRERDGTRVDPALVGDLERALAAVEITGDADTDDAQPPRDPGIPRSIAIPNVRVDVIGRETIATPFGPGRVARGQLEAVEAAARALTAPLAEVVDRRLAAGTAQRIVLADGAVLELHGRARIGDRDADPARVTELLDALAAPRDIVKLPGGGPRARLTAGDTQIELRTGAASRAGEPIALALAPADAQILARGADALVDRTAWQEDPLTISQVRVGATRYARGATIGAWTRDGAPLDAATATRVEQFAAQLARPTSTAPESGAVHVTLTISPPTGAPYERSLDLPASAAESLSRAPSSSSAPRATASPREPRRGPHRARRAPRDPAPASPTTP